MGIIDELPWGRNLAELRERERRIVEAVRRGVAEPEWATVSQRLNGRELVFHPMRDALKLEGVRVNVSATGAQRIADLLGAILPTAALSDAVYTAAVKLDPQPRQISATTGAMVAHSADVDREIVRRGASSDLVADPGKQWILTRELWAGRPERGLPPGELAANFGWHVPGPTWQGISANRTPTGLWAIQGGPHGGLRHDRHHTDYSQTVQLVRRDATLDGVAVDLAELVTDPELAFLVSTEGALPGARQPGVELEPGAAPEPEPDQGGGGVTEIDPVTIEAEPGEPLPQAQIARGRAGLGAALIVGAVVLTGIAVAASR